MMRLEKGNILESIINPCVPILKVLTLCAARDWMCVLQKFFFSRFFRLYALPYYELRTPTTKSVCVHRCKKKVYYKGALCLQSSYYYNSSSGFCFAAFFRVLAQLLWF